MAYGNCNTCGAGISWDKQKREAMNTRRPLNYDGTIHICSGGNGMHPPAQQQQQQPQRSNPIQQTVTDQDQKSKDIKAAQEERKRQHIESIKNLQWNTKMLAFVAEQNGGGNAKEILKSMGFEEFREEQHNFEDDML